jgi:hypothetical protein
LCALVVVKRASSRWLVCLFASRPSSYPAALGVVGAEKEDGGRQDGEEVEVGRGQHAVPQLEHLNHKNHKKYKNHN